jgi:3-phenylpropionate/trans-cinnamate dioxygenase ferredoxin component
MMSPETLIPQSERYTFIDVTAVDDIKPGERIFIEADDQTIVLFNIAGNFFAIEDVCSHDQGPLGDGEINDHEIHCPRHGASFDVRTGKVISLPAVSNIPIFPVRIIDGVIQLGLPEES